MAKIKKNARLLDEMAMAIATGTTVRQWAIKQGIPERTCYDWSRTPGFRTQVTDIRRRFIDANVGMLVVASSRATCKLVNLLDSSFSPSIQLSAARTILENVIHISNWADYEDRMSAVERRLESGKTDVKSTQED
jgi:hypothetical protein